MVIKLLLQVAEQLFLKVGNLKKNTKKLVLIYNNGS